MYQDLNPILSKLSVLPDNKKKHLLAKLSTSYRLGLRSLVLKETSFENKSEMERLFLKKGDDGLMEFGLVNITNFQEKLDQTINQIHSTFLKSLNI